jgi:hypothetical protein
VDPLGLHPPLYQFKIKLLGSLVISPERDRESKPLEDKVITQKWNIGFGMTYQVPLSRKILLKFVVLPDTGIRSVRIADKCTWYRQQETVTLIWQTVAHFRS